MAGVDEAEPACSRAALPVDHEGGRAVGPALEDVGTARLLAHGDEIETAHRPLQLAVLRAHDRLGPEPRGLGVGQRHACCRIDTGLGKTSLEAAGPRPGESGQVRGCHSPGHVLPLVPAPLPAPQASSSGDHCVDHRRHGDAHTLRRQRRHGLVGDAAGNDVPEHAEVGVDVEGEAVHRASSADPDADGGDLAGSSTTGVDPDPRIVAEPAGTRQAHVGQRVDDELLHGVHVVAGGARNRRHTDDRIADQLAGAVIGDVASPIGSHQLGPDRLRADQNVLGPSPHAERVDVGMLEEKQIVVAGPREQRPLERVGVVVADPSEPACPKHLRPRLPAYSSWAQSLVSRTSRSLARNRDA